MPHLSRGICKQNASSDTDTACRCLVIPALALERQLHSADRGAPFSSISRFPSMGLYWWKCASKACAVGRTLLRTGGREWGSILQVATDFRNVLLSCLSIFPGSVQNKTILWCWSPAKQENAFPYLMSPGGTSPDSPSHRSPSVIQEIPWNDKSTWTRRSNYIFRRRLSFLFLP